MEITTTFGLPTRSDAWWLLPPRPAAAIFWSWKAACNGISTNFVSGAGEAAIFSVSTLTQPHVRPCLTAEKDLGYVW